MFQSYKLRVNVSKDQRNRKSAPKMRKLEIVQTTVISCLKYRSIHHCKVHLSNNLMFRQQMTRIILVARYDKIKLPAGSNNMCRTQF